MFPGDCSWGDRIEEGDEIRADGEGEYEHRECADLHGFGLEDDPSEPDVTIDDLFGP
jgi:hypothetical protein